jgi:hypothetical protein
MNIRPVIFQWDGEAMVPPPRFQRLCDQQFAVGETYTLIPHEDRSAATHRHFFAQVNDTWQNLPEAIAAEFPTSEHLRKYALIKAGFCDRRTLVASSAAEARRLAAFVKPMDEFALVVPTGSTVTVYTAQSQSTRAMGKDAFQKSKEAVLDMLAGMIGVRPRRSRARPGEPRSGIVQLQRVNG